MNDAPAWKVAHLDDIERRGRDIPVREHLGIHAFGVNAFEPGADGTLVSEHDEAGSGQEELYIVLDGRATFEIDGETIDAPPGTLVYVGPNARRKATGGGTVLVVGATPGEAYQGIDWGEAWPFHSETTRVCITTTRASQRLRATPATTRSPTSDGPSSCSRGSARTRAETTTSPPCATTRGSKRRFADGNAGWAVTGSNRRPPACKAGALPSELTALPSQSNGVRPDFLEPGRTPQAERGAAG
jgi:hypothetical protein